MDGFDDLLDTSKSNPILDNPFEDPFARPRSPDPWLTYQQQLGREEVPTPVTEHSREPPTSVLQPSIPSVIAQTSDTEAVDPLDAKAANEEDDIVEAPRTSQRQPSEVVSSSHTPHNISPMLGTPAAPSTVPVPQPEPELAPTTHPLPEESSSPSQSPSAPVKEESPPFPQSPAPNVGVTPLVSRPPTSETKSPTSMSSPSAKAGREPKPTPARIPVVSPLESGSTNGQPSFATLALGGEMPGWQGSLSQSTFVNQVHASGQDDGNSITGWSEHGNREGFINGAPRREETDDDDDDDDVPIAKVHPATLVPSVEPTRGPEIQPMFVIAVGDPQKVGDPVRAFITYTVHTRTTSPLYRRSAFSVLRRYSDFLWLYETLSANYPGVIVPPVPEKQQYGRFQDTFVENRRAALNKCIQKIANHPSLRDDPDLKLFLESDNFVLDIKQRKAEIAHERGGLMATIGSSLVGPRFYETDEWFDNKRAYLDSLESQLRGLVKAIDIVAKQRTEVALSMAEFAENIAGLSVCDMSKQLSHTLSVLAEVQKKAKELQDLQAREDVSTIMSTVDEYARLVNSVRLAFTSRVRLYASWQNADNDVRKTQQAHEKARRQGRIPADRLSSSLAEIAEAERRAMEAKQEFDNASKMIKSELARFEQERVEDFKSALMAFLDCMIAKQKEIIQSWEHYQETLLKRLDTNPAPSTLTSPQDPVQG